MAKLFLYFLVFICVYTGSAFGSDLKKWSIAYGIISNAMENKNSNLSYGLNDLCHEQLKDYGFALENKTRWAVKLQDASGFVEGGLYWGNSYWLGSRDQCLIYSSNAKMSISKYMKIDYPDSTPPFPVSYYVVYVKHNSSILTRLNWDDEDIISIGLCLPSSCTTNQLSSLFQEYLPASSIPLHTMYDMSLELISVKKTEQDDSYKKMPMYTIFIFVSHAILLLAFIGTCYESFYCSTTKKTNVSNNNFTPQINTTGPEIKEKRESKFSKTLTAFSITKNIDKLFEIKKEEDMIKSINGLRVTSIIVMILSHAIVYNAFGVKNKLSLNYIGDSFFDRFTYNPGITVDSFYIISGFLLGYYFFKDNDVHNTSQRRNWKIELKEFVKGISRRYLRLTPLHLYTILLSTVSFAYYKPMASLSIGEKIDETCPRYWWTNLAYVNNIYPTMPFSCLTWTYYICNDMQYYIFGSFLLYLSLFKMKASIIIGILTSIASTLIVFYTVFAANYYPFLHLMYNNTALLYGAPWIRISSYLVGVLASYVYTYHRHILDGKPRRKILAWILYFTCMYYSLYGLEERDSSLWYSAFYTVMSRHTWSIGYAISLFCLITNNIYDKIAIFHSYDFWIPLSRLCYGVYLINPVLIYIGILTDNKGVYMQDLQNNIFGSGLIIITFTLSFFMALLIEIPVNNLVSIYLPKRSTHIQHNEEINNNNEVYSKNK